MEEFIYLGKKYHVVRDDLLDPHINGNKARKFYWLNSLTQKIQKIISWGGAQSNAMYALSYLCKTNGWDFEYYTKKRPLWLKKQPIGNLKCALDNSMRLIELSPEDYNARVGELLTLSLRNRDESTGEKIDPGNNNQPLIIPQGGAHPKAEVGIKLLADEIAGFLKQLPEQKTAVVLASGTGTTAYYLQKNLPLADVYTLPCAGSGEYLREQMSKLGDKIYFPKLLRLQKSLVFAQPRRDIYDVYKTLLNSGIEFDLLYDCPTWKAVGENMELFKDKTVIFVHSGGIHGNDSQLKRYKRLNVI